MSSIFSDFDSSPSSCQLRDMPDGRENGVDIPTGADEWYRFAESYKHAADNLASSIATDPWGNAQLGLPMMFLYRHYIELHLKSLLLDAGELLDQPEVVPPKHYIKALWTRVRTLLLRIDGRPADDWFKRSDEIVAQFDDVDPSSLVFRYPVCNQGLPSLSSPLAVDAVNVRRIVSELHILLSGASTQIDVYMSHKHEMRAEGYGSEQY